MRSIFIKRLSSSSYPHLVRRCLSSVQRKVHLSTPSSQIPIWKRLNLKSNVPFLIPSLSFSTIIKGRDDSMEKSLDYLNRHISDRNMEGLAALLQSLSEDPSNEKFLSRNKAFRRTLTNFVRDNVDSFSGGIVMWLINVLASLGCHPDAKVIKLLLDRYLEILEETRNQKQRGEIIDSTFVAFMRTLEKIGYRTALQDPEFAQRFEEYILTRKLEASDYMELLALACKLGLRWPELSPASTQLLLTLLLELEPTDSESIISNKLFTFVSNMENSPIQKKNVESLYLSSTKEEFLSDLVEENQSTGQFSSSVSFSLLSSDASASSLNSQEQLQQKELNSTRSRANSSSLDSSPAIALVQLYLLRMLQQPNYFEMNEITEVLENLYSNGITMDHCPSLLRSLSKHCHNLSFSETVKNLQLFNGLGMKWNDLSLEYRATILANFPNLEIMDQIRLLTHIKNLYHKIYSLNREKRGVDILAFEKEFLMKAESVLQSILSSENIQPEQFNQFQSILDTLSSVFLLEWKNLPPSIQQLIKKLIFSLTSNSSDDIVTILSRMSDLRVPFSSLSKETRELIEKQIFIYASPENKSFSLSDFTKLFKNLSSMGTKWDNLQIQTREIFCKTIQATPELLDVESWSNVISSFAFMTFDTHYRSLSDEECNRLVQFHTFIVSTLDIPIHKFRDHYYQLGIYKEALFLLPLTLQEKIQHSLKQTEKYSDRTSSMSAFHIFYTNINRYFPSQSKLGYWQLRYALQENFIKLLETLQISSIYSQPQQQQQQEQPDEYEIYALGTTLPSKFLNADLMITCNKRPIAFIDIQRSNKFYYRHLSLPKNFSLTINDFLSNEDAVEQQQQQEEEEMRIDLSKFKNRHENNRNDDGNANGNNDVYYDDDLLIFEDIFFDAYSLNTRTFPQSLRFLEFKKRMFYSRHKRIPFIHIPLPNLHSYVEFIQESQKQDLQSSSILRNINPHDFSQLTKKQQEKLIKELEKLPKITPSKILADIILYDHLLPRWYDIFPAADTIPMDRIQQMMDERPFYLNALPK